MPIVKNHHKANEAAMQLIHKTNSTESTVGVEEAMKRHPQASPPRHTNIVRKRSSSEDGDKDASPTRPRKSIFLSSPRLPMGNETLEGMMMIQRCDAFDESDEDNENERRGD